MLDKLDAIEKHYDELTHLMAEPDVVSDRPRLQTLAKEHSSIEEIVSKYRATGQSLYINAVKDGKDNINQDIKIWRLVRSEGQFKDYLASRINSLLTE